MLAVLALIGILSLIAVTGILYAFNKHKANAIIQDVSLTAAVVITNEAFLSVQDEQQIINAELPESSLSGFPVTPFRVNTDVFVITVQNVPQSVCKHVMTGPNPSDFLIEVNGAVAKENPKTLCTNNTNTMNFYFDASQNAERCGGQICTNGHVCVDDACVCPDDRVDQNGVCVCQNGMEECNGQCYNPCDFSQPGMLGTRDPISCQCLCDQAGGFKPFAQNGTCVCDNGFLLNNACVSLACEPAGCTDGNCTCYITTAGGEKHRCGTGCSPTGASCTNGSCIDVGQCPVGTIQPVTYNDQPYYGCRDEDLSCVFWTTSSGYNCMINDRLCGTHCQVDSTSCGYGDCENRCETLNLNHESILDHAPLPSSPFLRGYGCYNPENDMFCYNRSGFNLCYLNGEFCATGCLLDGTNCTTSTCETCPTGTEPFQNGTLHGCRNEDVVCVPQEWIRGKYDCYQITDSTTQQCGRHCQVDGHACQDGVCHQSDCPNDSVLLYKKSLLYGCYHNEEDLWCTYKQGAAYINCYLGDKQCGTQCTDLSGTGCPACFNTFECPSGTTLTTGSYGNVVYDACKNKEDVVCLNDAQQHCYVGNQICGLYCSLDGTGCSYGACSETELNCPQGTVLGFMNFNYWQVFGCKNSASLVNCTKINNEIKCTKNGSVCGSGCSLDGTGCTTGVCAATDCPDGQEPVYDTSDAFKCATVDKTVSCSGTTGSYTCSINNNICGYNCADEQGSSCEQGICRADECPTGFSLDYVTSGTYGCTNPDTFTQCFRTGSTYTCWKNGALCGENCSVSGTGGSCDTGCQ